ncbi:MAG: M20/M25/M40 family metallo-hydrolase [Lachnospiraceae bacterium]|nr:M20/M25/M40 family metallo-hydrolase [Cuneatibacter sp.]MDD6455729.1 M20/M25/M40 family metallo-hydrolase [Lachnospiraceae bacterium]
MEDKERLYAEHLSRLIQVPTVSRREESQTDFAAFEQYHKTLEELYPLVHRHLTREIIGKANLLYHWKGTSSDKAPVVLMSHQDVVPEGDWSKWKYPPFSGALEEGKVWGRGTVDCKSTMLVELEAVEALLAEGFTPDFDVYLALGQDEEIMSARHGAGEIARHLESLGVKPGVVFDEGPGYSKKKDGSGATAAVVIGEKGYQDFEIYTEDKGGHACMPGATTGLGRLARGIIAVEENPMPYRLIPAVAQMFRAIANDRPEEQRAWFADPEAHLEELKELAKTDRMVDAQLRSTTAVTMACGSAQANILPEYAYAIINCRPMEGDTIETMQAHFDAVLPADVKARFVDGGNPPRSSRTDTRAWQLIEEIGTELFGSVEMKPQMNAGGTDSRAYADMCDCVYRFNGLFEGEGWGPAHAVNECIPTEALPTGVHFMTEFLRRW